MADFTDAKVYPVLAELSACLCTALGPDATPCFCGVLFGRDIPVEYAGDCDECGAAYVRLLNSFQSTDEFPSPDITPTCSSLTAWTIAVGIVRCSPVGDNRGNPPTPEEMQESARRALADMDAIRNAIRCCFAGKFDDEFEYVLGQFLPIPDPGVIGGEQTIILREI
jgi:hypothetical protein